MSLRSDLYDYITADGSIVALIGTRFYWLQLPENVTYPATRYFVVSRQRTAAHDGSTGLDTITIQIDILAEDDGQAESVSTAFKAALDGFKDSPLSGLMINEYDQFEGEGNLWRVTHEYLIHRVSTA